MSLGMGADFVPLTLTAVHHVRAEDSGIGSGVLNTMQQVGGALGLATLAPWRRTLDQHRRPARRPPRRRPRPQAPQPSAEQLEAIQAIAQHQVFTEGATTAFLVGSAMMLLASLVVWIFLDVKHDELATDGPEVPVHV